ncbi:unnamed protein product [Paramecium primaurelia]|uniref:Derlin n=1 Tax=Paramecium primaurelia TaxID=5886 RepID=A0A8S1JMW3_PARPR|nr:unnamed protein product [Paramecium primaurelia]
MNLQSLPQEQQSLQGFINQIPFGIKLVTIITFVVFLINTLFDDQFTKCFQDQPLKVFQEYQIQRLFFTQFIESIFGLIIMPLFICMNLSDLEKTIGTVVFLLDFFFKNFMIQVIFLILSLITLNNIKPSQGLWNVYIVYISLQCFANPDQLRSLFFFPCVVPSKYIPYGLVMIGLIMNQNIDSIAALILAYVEANYYNFMIFRPSQHFIKRLENSFLFKKAMSRQDFFVMTQNLQGNPSTQQQQLPVRQAEEYQGKGIQIGGSTNFDNIVIDNNDQFQQDDSK